MRVLFEFSRGGLPEHQRAIGMVRELILQAGHTLTNDPIKESAHELGQVPESAYDKLQKAIAGAQCVVIEGSVVSLSLGFVLTEAINLGKPVLFLVEDNSMNQRNRFVKSIKSKLVTYKCYASEGDLEAMLHNFFEHHTDIRTRFNLVLSNYLNSYVTVESQKKHISKTEYIIELIEADEKRKYGR